MKIIEDGEPCDRSCAHHVTHACEECGRLHMIGKAIFIDNPWSVTRNLSSLGEALNDEDLPIYVNGILWRNKVNKKSTLTIGELYQGRWYIFLPKAEEVQLTYVDDKRGHFDLDGYGYSFSPEHFSRYKTMGEEIFLLDLE